MTRHKKADCVLDVETPHRKESDHVRSEYAEKKKLLDVQLKDQPFAPVYMYSGQKLRVRFVFPLDFANLPSNWNLS